MTQTESFSLKEFSEYSAQKPDRVISSADPEASRNWARKASFMQLGYALEMYRMDHEAELTPEQQQAIDAFSAHAFSADFQSKALTEHADIKLALDTLEILGLDVTKQKEQLQTWQ